MCFRTRLEERKRSPTKACAQHSVLRRRIIHLRRRSCVVGPVRHRVDLTTIPDQDAFTGIIDIDLQFLKQTSVLWLNAEKLTIKEATLTWGSQKLAARIISEPKDYVGFSFDHPIGSAAATLHVAYQGEVSRKDQSGIFQMKDGDRGMSTRTSSRFRLAVRSPVSTSQATRFRGS